MKNYRQLKKELLKNKEVRKAYDRLEAEYVLAEMIIRRRIESGLTQQQLAKRAGTKQSAISRLESGNYNPSVSFLSKIAKALGGKLNISIRRS